MGAKNKNNFLPGFILSFVFTLLIVGAILVGSEVLAVTVDSGLGATLDLGTADLESTVISIIQWALGFLGLVAVVMMLYGGFLWMTARGNEDQVAKAKKVLIRAAIGLAIVLLSWAIVAFIVNAINDTTTPYPDHCYNGVQDIIEGETGIDCGGPCPSCPVGPGLPTDTFTWTETQTSFASPGNYATNVNRCSKIQPIFNHRIDQSSFVTAFTNGHLKLETDDGTGNWSEFIVTNGAIEVATSRNGITIKHDDDLLAANTDFRLWIPKYVLDLSSDQLETCSITTGICNEDSNPYTGGTNDSFVWYFSVGNEVDLINPYITQTNPVSPPDPGHPYRNVSMSPVMEVKFNEAIDISSIDDGSGNPIDANFDLFRYDPDGIDPPAPVRIDNSNFEIVLTSGGFNIILTNGYVFDAFTWYDITIRGVEDLCSNAMVGDYNWQFQTNDLQPGIAGRYPTGTAACPSATPIVLVTFNTTMYYSDVQIELSGGGDVARANIYAEGMAAPPGIFATGGSNSIIEIMDTNDVNQFRAFQLRPTFPLVVGTTYTVNIVTDKVMNIDGNLLNDSWQFTVVSADQCRCEPIISHISPAEGFEEQCITINGLCFDGEGKAAAVPPTLTFYDATDNSPNNVTGVIGGSGPNYITTTVPDSFRFANGDIRPTPQIQITYDEPDLGTPASNNNAVRYFITQDQAATGPCLWSLNPTSGYIGDGIDLYGDRFVPALPNLPFNQYIGFDALTQYNYIWGTHNISSWVNVNPGNLIEGVTYDVSVNYDVGADSLQSNAIPYNVKITPPGQSLVQNIYPTCTAACVNVVVRATVTNSPNIGTIAFDQTGNDTTASVRMFPCTDSSCNTVESPAVNLTGSTAMPNGTGIDLTLNHPDLTPDKSYRIILTDSITNISGGTIVTNYDFGALSTYSWIFKTKNDATPCTLDHVNVVPANHTMPSLQIKQYDGYGYGPPDECDPNNGQLLPVANWNWTSSDNTIATITNNNPLDNNPNHQIAAGVSSGGPVTITANADGIAGTGQLTITDCETDQHCRNNCNVAGNQSICLDNICTPWIGEIDPASGPKGTTITINGCYFGNNKAGGGEVLFSNQSAIFNCNNYWTNSSIIATTPDTLNSNVLYGVYVYTDINDGGYSNISQAPTAMFHVTDLCARMCDAASDNAYEACNNDGECNANGAGTCLPAANPPATGMPGLCSVNPDTRRLGESVDYDGFNLVGGAGSTTLADFSKLNQGYTRTTGTLINSTTLNNVTVPSDASSGPTRLVIDTGGGSYCASNSDDFFLYCAGSSDCATNCCINNQCQDTALCSSGTPGSLCQLPANNVLPNPTCQEGPLVKLSSNYSCIDLEGHSDPYITTPPIGYPPAPGDDCRVCCAPGQTNGSLGCNVNTVGVCSGTDRGLYCGCSYDQANPGPGDTQCDNGTGEIACGSDTCCHSKMQIWLTSPTDGEIDVCPNSRVDIQMLNGYLGSASVADNDLELWDITAGNIELEFNYYILPAKDQVVINPKELFEPNHVIRLIARGGPDGILSDQGIALSETGLNYDYDSNGTNDSRRVDFTVGNEICQVDHFQIEASADNPPPDGNIISYDIAKFGDLFTCASDACRDDIEKLLLAGNQHEYVVSPQDSNDQYLNAGDFNWTWTEFSDPDNIIEIFDINPTTKYITPNNQNGIAAIRVTADDIPGSPDFGSHTQDIKVQNIICENPWPNPHLAVAELLPFEDTVAHPKPAAASQVPNFSTWYCRDSGLPELERVADIGITEYGVSNNGVDEKVKQYLIELPTKVDDLNIGDGIGIQVWQNEGGLSARDWFFDRNPGANEPQELIIDGYSAVRDGRSVYVAAWNILGTGVEGQPAINDRLWPNIYIISHSQTANQQMIEIFNQLVNNFELNVNIYSLDEKFAMKRDLQRVADLNTVFEGLLDYYQNNGAYPLIPGGTFIQGLTTSAWPSWKDTLGTTIDISMPRDPYNTFNNCPFESTDTCWDDGDTDNDGQSQEYECPVDSSIYQYLANGADSINLFGRLEYLHAQNGAVQEEFFVGPDAPGERCDGISNATCPCFNYVKNTTGIPSDRLGPEITSITDGSSTVGPGGTLSLSGNETIGVNATDANGVERIEFLVGYIWKYTDDDGTGPGWTWEIDTRQYFDSPPLHNLTIKAFDIYGNWSQQNFNLAISNSGTVDQAPFIDILNISDGDVISGEFEIKVVASDDGSLANLLVRGFDSDGNVTNCLTGGILGSIADNPVSYNPVWDTIECAGNLITPNGDYTITAEVFDNSLQRSEKTVFVRVQNFDTTPPVITIGDINGTCSLGANPPCSQNNACADPNALCQREGIVPLQFTVTDLNGVESVSVFIDGNLLGVAENTTNDNWEIDWNTITFPNGTYTVQVFAYDEYGNESTAVIDIIIDNATNDIEPPTLAFIHPPTPNYGVSVNGIVNLAVLADDNRGVASVHFFIDYRLPAIDPASPWEHQVDTNNLSDGWHTFQAIAVDTAGNMSDAVEVLVNVRGNGGPNISNASVHPTTGGVGSNRCFQAEVTDGDGVKYVSAIIQDENEKNLFSINMTDNAGNDIYTAIWTSTDIGVFYVDIEASDNMGNISRYNNVDGFNGECGSGSNSVRLAAGTSDGRLFISNDETGGSWTQIASIGGQFIFDFISTSDGSIYLATGTAGSVYKSEDNGVTWFNTGNLTSVDGDATQVFSLLEDSDGSIYAGTYASGGNTGGRVFRTTDGGVTWNATATLPGATRVHSIIKATDGYIYVGTRPKSELFRTNNAGVTWESLGSIIDPQINADTNIHTLIQANDGSFYAGLYVRSAVAQVWKSTNFGQTWANTGPISAGTDIYSLTQADDGSLLAGNIGDLAIPGSSLYRSTNNGGSWSPSGSVDAYHVFSLFTHPDGSIYAGTGSNFGDVWRSTDNGLTWSQVEDIPGVTQIYSLGTIGFSSALPLSTPNITSPTSANATEGSAFSYLIETNIPATTYYASNLPSWLSLSSITGLITGTPPTNAAVSSPYIIGLRAENYDGIGPLTNLSINVSISLATCQSRCDAIYGVADVRSGTCLDTLYTTCNDSWNGNVGQCNIGNPAGVCTSPRICCCLVNSSTFNPCT